MIEEDAQYTNACSSDKQQVDIEYNMGCDEDVLSS
jgi:hypothetical protein